MALLECSHGHMPKKKKVAGWLEWWGRGNRLYMRRFCSLLEL